jgi:hypothetical protein
MSVNTNNRKVAPKPDTFFQPINVLSIENYRSGCCGKWQKKHQNIKNHTIWLVCNTLIKTK